MHDIVACCLAKFVVLGFFRPETCLYSCRPLDGGRLVLRYRRLGV